MKGEVIRMYYAPVPQEMYAPCSHPGTLQSFSYPSGGKEKNALVYLPFGYEEGAADYPVLYLMHGGGGDHNEFFGGREARTPLKNLLDNAIASGHVKPMIVVAPTYMIEGVEGARRQIGEALQLTHRFPREFMEDLIPAIDAAYRTRPDRKTRAFGGFSMGGETTWSVMAQALTHVWCLLPMSGDYWAIALKGGKDFPAETADALIADIAKSGIAPADYRVLPCTGDKDIAYEALDPMVHELEKRQPWFVSGEMPDEGNLCYCLKPNGWHTYDDCFEYLWLMMPYLFA